MTTKRMKQIQMAADDFRQDCRVFRYSLTNIFEECDRRGFQLVRYPIGAEGVLGFSQIRDEDKIIFSNSSVRLTREIFTVAHEIGHMLLHMGLQNSYVDDADTLSDYAKDTIETEANYFAACLLMPDDIVYKYISMKKTERTQWTALDIAKMMTDFNVSFEMILNRLQNLNQIDKKVKMQLDNEKNQKKVTNLLRMTGGDSKLNQTSCEKKIPDKYMDWVVFNYNHKLIPTETLEKALHYFDVTMEDISDELHFTEKESEDDLQELIGGMDD